MWLDFSQKGPLRPKRPRPKRSPGRRIQKGQRAPTGSESVKAALGTASEPVKVDVRSRSECVGFHEQIVTKIELGLTAQRIYQDLVADHGFTAKYHRCAAMWLRQTGSKELPVRRMEVEPGQEMQIDYGQGARCQDHTGKYRKTYVFRMVQSHSRKGYTEAVTRLTTESHHSFSRECIQGNWWSAEDRGL